jgi:hypothetical protein
MGSVVLGGKSEKTNLAIRLPFSSLYTYSDSVRDIGNCKGDDEFAAHYRFVADGIFRVLQTGRLCSIHLMDLPTSITHNGYIGLRDFPGLVTQIMKDAGFIYHSKAIIWKDPVTAMQRTKALGLLYKQVQKDSSMIRQGIPDEVRTFRKPGVNAKKLKRTPNEMPLAEDKCPEGWDKRHNWQNYASPVWMDINPSDTLQRTSAREDNDEKHICPLQLDVIRRLLQLWSNPNDVVLSPFAGIGSEGYESIKAGRRFVGVELKDAYFRQAVKNLQRAEVEINERTLLST